HLCGGGDDTAGGAVVAGKSHGPGSGIILLEALEAGRVGAAKAIDRLIGIADGAKVRPGGSQRSEQPVLLLVETLEFVDGDTAPAVALVRGETGVLRQRVNGKCDEIVEVDPIALGERACVGCRHPARSTTHAAVRSLLARDCAQQPLRLA